MIIVEGPDGAGKTTLVDALVGQGMELQPRACTSDNGVDPATLAEWVEQDLKKPRTLTQLYDRHPLFSEPIYGPIIRGHMADGFANQNWYYRSLRTFRRMHMPTIIFCLPPLETVLENVAAGHDYHTDHLRGVHKHSKAIYDQYVTMMGWAQLANFHVGVWDYTHPSAPELWDEYMSIAQTRVKHGS